MPNYNNSKIYKLVSSQTDKIYIGSTTEKLLCSRFSTHKRDYKNKNTHSSYELIKYDDCKIVLIENYSCDNRQDLLKRERYYIENNNNCVNQKLPSRTIEEYRKDNLKILSAKKKEWRHNNPEKDKATAKRYYEKNKQKILEKVKCECGCIVNKSSLNKHKKSKKHLLYLNNE